LDSSLWLLTRLRMNAAYRRWKRSLARPKGILVSIVFVLLFTPSIAGMIAITFINPVTLPGQPINRFGPVAFFVLTVLTLGGSTRDSALYFAPAEIDFLFAGPFRRRQLVGYKLLLVLLGSLFSALIIGFSGRIMAARFASAVVGSILAVMFIQLAQMVLALAINLAGAIAWSRARRVGIFVLLGLGVLAVFPNRETVVATDWKAFGLGVESSPVTALLLAPFRPFVYAYSAQSPSQLLRWGGLALLVDLVLVGLVFALDAGYLEASTIASGKRLAQIQKVVGGGGTLKMGSRRTGRFRFRPPQPVWWGGVGPNLWRQMTSAIGDPARLLVILILVGGLEWFHTWILPRDPVKSAALLPIEAVFATVLTLLLSMFFCFDFRGDIDVMETLKTLPIPPSRLVLGQLLTPTILMTLMQAVACLGLVLGTASPPESWWILAVLLAYLVPGNLFFFGVENLLFLWYPTRMVAGQFNGLAVARQMLLLVTKGVAIGLAAGIVAAVGAVGYFVLGRQLAPALILGWITLAGLAVGLLPLLGRAFVDFDVNLDTPA